MPNIADFYSFFLFISCIPGLLLRYFLDHFEIFPVSPITGIIIIIIIIIIITAIVIINMIIKIYTIIINYASITNGFDLKIRDFPFALNIALRRHYG